MTTGEKIAEQRKKLNLTQQQFADRLGVTRQAVSRWESDLAFPETDKLVELSRLFGCSVDYLLKYDEKGDGQPDGKGDSNAESDRRDEDANGENSGGANTNASGVLADLFNLHFEYKSKRTVCGMPLVHVNIGFGRCAKGVFSVGLISSGIFSFGLLSMGVFSFGLLSLGLLSFGSLVLGGLAAGGVALGLLAFGGVAVGLISFGGVAIGLCGVGGCSIGLFACGGYANGALVAIGDYAVGGITFGKSTSLGDTISVTVQNFASERERAFALMDDLPAFWRGFINLSKTFASTLMRQ